MQVKEVRLSIYERAQAVQKAAAEWLRNREPFPPPPPSRSPPSPPPEEAAVVRVGGRPRRGGRTEAYHRFSMRSLVVVTSSDDPRVAPGVHRLMDIPVFADQPCKQVPYARCKRRNHPQLPYSYRTTSERCAVRINSAIEAVRAEEARKRAAEIARKKREAKERAERAAAARARAREAQTRQDIANTVTSVVDDAGSQ